MLALIADANAMSIARVRRTLADLDVDLVITDNGTRALDMIRADPRIALALLDWELPGTAVLEICKQLRRDDSLSGVYVLVLMPSDCEPEVVTALEAGADDYIAKPFDRNALLARVKVALRILALQQRLGDKVEELHDASSQLHGLMPICSYCKQVNPESEQWQEVDHYIASHSEMKFTHHICPRCYEAAVRQLAQTGRSTDS